jgi:hypothetical protein
MELTELRNRLIGLFSDSEQLRVNILDIVENDQTVFPFNEYEHMICHMLNHEILNFQEYLDLRNEYIDSNPNLYLYEISAPRGFGEKFAQTYLKAKCSNLAKPNRNLDTNYSGEYDFWLDGIRIEVKASRAVDSDSDEPLYMKALSVDTDKNFVMNFQQLKPQCCDVFVWVAVFRDEIIVWVLASNEVYANPLFSRGQHRGNSGNEGQMHINQNNIRQMDQFKLDGDNLEQVLRAAADRNRRL